MNDWRKQLKSKALYVVMLVLGCFYGTIGFIGFIVALARDENENAAGVMIFLMLAAVFCVIFGSIKMGMVSRHNQQVIDKHRENIVRNQPQPVSHYNFAPQSTPADEIKKYQDLFLSGAISKEEYDAKKAQLLNL